jgi:hydrogenase-4 transcriptional activator
VESEGISDVPFSKGQAGSGMSFEAELWREVGQHLELEESVRRLARLLHRVVPLDVLLVRRLDRDPLRLTTVAYGARTAAAPAEPEVARSECDAEAARAVTRFLTQGDAVLIASAPQSSAQAALARALLPAGLRGHAIAGPLVVRGEAVGVALLLRAGVSYDDSQLGTVEGLLEALGVAFENDQRLRELARMREALEADRQALLSRLERQDISDSVVGAGAGLRSVMERVEQVARTDAPVLILGETGSGKEVIARAIHARSTRATGPVVRVNCGAIPAELIDSELFGHERGAFTGAVAMRKGWFERADGGTLFLDEIGELPAAAQVRLLRVLQDGSLERVGGGHVITVDVRIVAATHRQLDAMVAEGAFREDLWYRISVFPIRLPPLRERSEDIPTLAGHFARRAGQRLGGMALEPSAQDVSLLRAYPWPGNVRELMAVIERAAILGDGKRLEVGKALGIGASSGVSVAERRSASAPPAPPTALAAGGTEAARDASTPSLDVAMRGHIERALTHVHGRIEGPFGAARLLGINPHTLRARMRKLGIDWAKYRQAPQVAESRDTHVR